MGVGLQGSVGVGVSKMRTKSSRPSVAGTANARRCSSAAASTTSVSSRRKLSQTWKGGGGRRARPKSQPADSLHSSSHMQPQHVERHKAREPETQWGVGETNGRKPTFLVRLWLWFACSQTRHVIMGSICLTRTVIRTCLLHVTVGSDWIYPEGDWVVLVFCSSSLTPI